MSYLIDTDVVSGLRRPEKNHVIRNWFEANADRELYISVITLGELRRGVEMRRGRDEAHAALLEVWLEELKSSYRNQILPVETAVADVWGRLTAAHNQHPADALIAATALVHGLTVVTRNVRHFTAFPVRVLSPS